MEAEGAGQAGTAQAALGRVSPSPQQQWDGRSEGESEARWSPDEAIMAQCQAGNTGSRQLHEALGQIQRNMAVGAGAVLRDLCY